MSLYWKLFDEWYPTEVILERSFNPLKTYLTSAKGIVIDIGCGPASHLLDFLGTKLELCAVDKDFTQLNYLKKRVANVGYPIERLTYHADEFNSELFKGKFFSAIILSNILHFYDWESARKMISMLEKHIKSETYIFIAVHSKRHPKNKLEKNSENYFKYFYGINDLNILFPKTKYEYLYYEEVIKYPDALDEKFIRQWLTEILIARFSHISTFEISAFQQKYLLTAFSASIILVLKRR